MRSKYKMRSNIKNKDLLKIQPFYSEEIKDLKKGEKNYLNYHYFLKNKVIFNYQKSFHSFQKALKDLKD